MGGSSSTNLKVSVVNDTINKSILNFSPSTVSNISALNYLEVGEGGIAQGNEQVINMTSSLTSMYEASQSTDFSTSMNNAVSNDVEKQTISFLSDMMGCLMNKDTNVSTSIRNNVENMNLAEVTPACISNIDLVNSIVIKPGAKAIDNKQTILGNFYQKCIGSVDSSMNSVAETVNTANQKAKITEENPLQFLADMVGNVTGAYSIIIICVIGGFLYLVAGGFLGSGEGSPLSDLTKGFGSALSGGPKKLIPI